MPIARRVDIVVEALEPNARLAVVSIFNPPKV